MLSETITNLSELTNKIRALNSSVTKAVVKLEVDRMLDKLNLLELNISDENYNISWQGIGYNLFIKNIDYDTIMNDKDTYINSIDNISCTKSKNLTLCSHNNLILSITLYLSCPLPEEDLLTLRDLGKVHMDKPYYSESSESIICEI